MSTAHAGKVVWRYCLLFVFVLGLGALGVFAGFEAVVHLDVSFRAVVWLALFVVGVCGVAVSLWLAFYVLVSALRDLAVTPTLIVETGPIGRARVVSRLGVPDTVKTRVLTVEDSIEIELLVAEGAGAYQQSLVRLSSGASSLPIASSVGSEELLCGLTRGLRAAGLAVREVDRASNARDGDVAG